MAISPASAPVSAEIALLHELTPVVERNLNRHLAMAQEWMPHEYVPWSLGRDFTELPWDESQSGLSDVARVAFEVNLLTEDNLPSYHREIVAAFGLDGPWGQWAHQWTAEEGRHSIVMRDYLLVTRAVDPVALERGRMLQMRGGFGRPDTVASPLRTLAYVSFQELATRISHRNTGAFTGEPVARRLLARVAADENLHMIFYRDLLAAALDIDPSAAVRAIADEVTGFEMPGTGIADFEAKAVQIAKAGIYDLRIHHDDVLGPILRHWNFFSLTGLDGEAERARERVAAFMGDLDGLASHYDEKRAAAARAAGQAEPVVTG